MTKIEGYGWNRHLAEQLQVDEFQEFDTPTRTGKILGLVSAINHLGFRGEQVSVYDDKTGKKIAIRVYKRKGKKKYASRVEKANL